MEHSEYFNSNYYLLAPKEKYNGLFSSFGIFKSQRFLNHYAYDERPPYPILNDSASVEDVFYNLNKSDFVVFLSALALGQAGSLLATKNMNNLQAKFKINKYIMLLYGMTGCYLAMSCSFYRLTGLMDNGLRWKRQNHLDNKYDLTSQFERNSIFKHFRDRAD